MGVKGVLEVHLLDARGLKSSDLLSKMDPFVILQYKTEQGKSRVLREGGTKPTWNERFTFPAEYTASDHKQKLVLKIMDNNRFTAADFAGAATIFVGDLMDFGAELGIAEMPAQRYNVVLADGTYYGDVRVGVTFRRTEEVS
ncbi:elicitor-responsive protein 1-like [Wolffia australiana]